jgi:hypothetical protein
VSFDPTWLFLSLIPSAIGLVLSVYGRKQHRWPQLAAGLAFMVYPYFTPSPAGLVGGGVLIGIGLWSTLRLGW